MFALFYTGCRIRFGRQNLNDQPHEPVAQRGIACNVVEYIYVTYIRNEQKFLFISRNSKKRILEHFEESSISVFTDNSG